jgi:glutamate formiminotransferase
MAVPNVSEGRDGEAIRAIGEAFRPARLLDTHSDGDHGRSVYSLAARQGDLAGALVAGARAVLARLDLRRHLGLHPHVGALDVLPVVYLRDADRGAACAEALTAAALIGEEVGVPVFLYGELATDPARRERAAFREGGPEGLRARVAAGEVLPDYGPARVDSERGAVLAAARPPLVAFNLDLDTEDVVLAREVAAGLRESGGGPPGVRAIGLFLPARGRAQVSMNVQEPARVPLGELVDRVRSRVEVAEAEVVGLAPRAALQGFPEDVPMRGFDPERHVIENALRSIE